MPMAKVRMGLCSRREAMEQTRELSSPAGEEEADGRVGVEPLVDGLYEELAYVPRGLLLAVGAVFRNPW